jgi:hypothetical protein
VIFWTDEDFDGDILRGVLAQHAESNITRIQDMGMRGFKDDILLEEAAKQSAVYITHDRNTLIDIAYDRVRAGLPMPGVIVVKQFAPIRTLIDDLLLVIEANDASHFENLVLYIPL